MDSPQQKLGSMDSGKTPPLLLVAQLAKKAIAASPFPDANRLASAWWAFVTAWFFPVSFALGSVVAALLCSLLQCCTCDLTEREGDPIDSALWIGLWCCHALQAAVAALALLLPFRHHRIRRALAYLAVSVAIVGRSLMATIVPLAVAAHPGLGYLLLVALFVCDAAALAQLLPCLPLRIRRALAYLAVAIVGLCILASFVALAADTGLLIVLILYSAVIFTLAVGDLLSFLALLLGGED